ncbi:MULTISPECIES: ABC transporter substrate-binding protein [Mesorhizobium]|uniref:ABC transport system substrate-binding protein n=1 Tax=Mesorhizobium shonense TaxID=1209948 RepID=A0ABV2HYH1_9HYPH|nr:MULTISPECIES: ABC transporter substrate-binding protein [unclassified Mesorhizobium]AZO29980.1 hypothetical protein EJ071_23005 [Mesorhizobium sp. M1B.F.Ca.ET.045.04.1.1]RWB20207.1 MAG: hypothetical protein EOQ40_16595 [Mesorhizobium sp.]RWE03324.1 MAG: hypothetical protein EOS40_03960 [Mesorhizobium sp.]TIS47171.1 MAG: hypothetical protein E5W96_24095 [Mesorhizobium sp.]
MRPSDIPVVGMLLAGDRSYPSFGSFCDAIRELGYGDGENIQIEPRFADGHLDRLPSLAAELVQRRAKIIVAIGAVSYLAAREAAPDLPIVFAIVLDPVSAKIVQSAERPGGHTTGCTNFDPGQIGEQVRMLKQVVPDLKCLAVLGDAGVPDILPKLSKAAAEAEGLNISVHLLGREEDLETAFAAFAAAEAGGLLCLEVPRTTTYGAKIVKMANDARLPAIFGRDHARYGPLMAYGTSLASAARRMASQVDIILKGADAGALPVEYVRRPELIVNLNAARKMAVTFPDRLLRLASQVVG